MYITHLLIVTKNNGFPYVVIPNEIAYRLQIMRGQYVNIHSRGDSIIIKKTSPPRTKKQLKEEE
ncbi:MAG TPA: AbrB/MazE/SpoVT family DNA-binding domain-containing protein [Nitrososphaeraceae archaeon]|nr:AbrB/MazE/SpoVT family DNA-binding domain-containing protein [Nitrososphaeraceae archaeon]